MQEQVDASAFLIEFLARYTQLVKSQLQDIRSSMVETVETVMREVTGISHITEEKRQHAERVLESTYINPDAETEVLIQDMQKVVDEIFEASTQHQSSKLSAGPLVSDEPEVLVRNRISRLSGKFAIEMDALTHLDDNMRKTVFGIIGALSSEDVIAQKLEHVVMSLKVLQTGLNYVLIDYDERCNFKALKQVTNEIKSFTFRQYTAEDEKRRFLAIFTENKKAS